MANDNNDDNDIDDDDDKKNVSKWTEKPQFSGLSANISSSSLHPHFGSSFSAVFLCQHNY